MDVEQLTIIQTFHTAKVSTYNT